MVQRDHGIEIQMGHIEVCYISFLVRSLINMASDIRKSEKPDAVKTNRY